VNTTEFASASVIVEVVTTATLAVEVMVWVVALVEVKVRVMVRGTNTEPRPSPRMNRTSIPAIVDLLGITCSFIEASQTIKDLSERAKGSARGR
jgi:hypothetical protein